MKYNKIYIKFKELLNKIIQFFSIFVTETEQKPEAKLLPIDANRTLLNRYGTRVAV